MKIKKSFFWLLVFFILINIISLIIIKVKTGENIFNSTKYLEKKNTYFIGEQVRKYMHPFIGQIDLNNKMDEENNITDEFLFYDIFETLSSNTNEELKILVLGGSVALNLSKNSDENNGKNILARNLSEVFPNKKLTIYNASLKAAKQPQQLFKLYYLYLLNYRFDIVINFDGPLELAHPIVKNLPLKEELIYPRRYSQEIAGMSKNFACIKNSNNLVKKNSFVPIIELYSLYKIKSCIDSLNVKNTPSFWKEKTKYVQRSEEENINRSLKIWQNSSLQMYNFSKLNNFFYLHVIIPNQYLKDSKILSDEEKEQFFGYEYQFVIEKYYEKFNFDNLKIKNSLDLKYVFKNIEKTTYRDKCCRYNDFGVEIISKKIAKYLKSNFINQ